MKNLLCATANRLCANAEIANSTRHKTLALCLFWLKATPSPKVHFERFVNPCNQAMEWFIASKLSQREGANANGCLKTIQLGMNCMSGSVRVE
eukprot:694533-Amphidinium_carterae.3